MLPVRIRQRAEVDINPKLGLYFPPFEDSSHSSARPQGVFRVGMPRRCTHVILDWRASPSQHGESTFPARTCLFKPDFSAYGSRVHPKKCQKLAWMSPSFTGQMGRRSA